MERTPRSNEEAELLGGFSPDDWEVDNFRSEHYSNKTHHFERSAHNDPNHEAVRSKVEYIIYERQHEE